MPDKPELFQLIGIIFLVLFVFAIWPPLALAGTGAFFMTVGLAAERKRALTESEEPDGPSVLL